MIREKLVIIGNGMAPGRALEKPHKIKVGNILHLAFFGERHLKRETAVTFHLRQDP